MRNIRKVVAAIGVSVVASLATSSVALAESASGSGATFPQNFLANATVNYNAKTGHNVTYANPGGGSSKGKSDFKANLTDFGGSDSAVTAAQASSFYSSSSSVFSLTLSFSFAMALALLLV